VREVREVRRLRVGRETNVSGAGRVLQRKAPGRRKTGSSRVVRAAGSSIDLQRWRRDGHEAGLRHVGRVGHRGAARCGFGCGSQGGDRRDLEGGKRDRALVLEGWDLDGAARAGLRTAWVDRTGAPYPAYCRPPDYRVPRLDLVADALG